jgi:hypothetical protein
VILFKGRFGYCENPNNIGVGIAEVQLKFISLRTKSSDLDK